MSEFRLENTLQGHSGNVRSVAFSPDPDGTRVVSGSYDKTVKIWHNDAIRMAHMALRQRLGEPGLTATIASYIGASDNEQKRYGRSVHGLNTDSARKRARALRRTKNLNNFNSIYPEGSSKKTMKRRSLSKSKSKKSKSRKHKSI
jgi:WD40 repeat protein